eukprot:gene7979-13884_t
MATSPSETLQLKKILLLKVQEALKEAFVDGLKETFLADIQTGITEGIVKYPDMVNCIGNAVILILETLSKIMIKDMQKLRVEVREDCKLDKNAVGNLNVDKELITKATLHSEEEILNELIDVGRQPIKL